MMCLLFHVTTSTELIYIPYFLCFEKLNAWFHLISFQWCFSSRMPLFSQYTKHKSFVFLVILYFVICSFAFNLCLACCHSLFSPFIGHYAEYCFFPHVCKKKKKKICSTKAILLAVNSYCSSLRGQLPCFHKLHVLALIYFLVHLSLSSLIVVSSFFIFFSFFLFVLRVCLVLVCLLIVLFSGLVFAASAFKSSPPPWYSINPSWNQATLTAVYYMQWQHLPVYTLSKTE